MAVLGFSFVVGEYYHVRRVRGGYLLMNGAHVSLTVEPSAVTNETSISLTTHNIGTSEIFLGLSYQVEKHFNDSWAPVPAQYMCIALGIAMRPGGMYTHNMSIDGLNSGSYRVTKNIYDAENAPLEPTFAEFSVERPPEEDTGEPPRYGFKYYYNIIPFTKNSPDGPTLRLMNFGARSLYFNSSYTLETKTRGQWHEVYVNEGDANVTTVKWGDEYRLRIGERPFTSGRYRLSIVFGVEGTSFRETLIEDFTS
ncbi:hypothetical protein JXL21_04740 [Candidatus Bathyarchaeota archaeon]|nr:hypothetical protein [Candidatus Bathyarchaeota archaeon]